MKLKITLAFTDHPASVMSDPASVNDLDLEVEGPDGLFLGNVFDVVNGVSETGGRAFNINADTTSVRLARALGAATLLLTTRVGGVFRDLDDPATRIDSITAAEARRLIADGVIAGGMIPKVEEALGVLEEGVGAIAIVGAVEPDAFRRVVRGEGGVGTRITP